MRLSKRIRIDGKEIIINELTIRQWMDAYAGIQTLTPFSVEFWAKVLPLVSNLDADALLDMAPSEIEVVVKAAMEVNQTLIESLKKTKGFLGEAGVMDALKQALQQVMLNTLTTFSRSLSE
jgi:hypothetical protein